MHLNVKDCEAYYCAQVGGGGNYYSAISHHQRGHGIFSNLRRHISPLVLKAGRYLGGQLFRTGKNVISDVVSGVPLRHSARQRLHETANKVKDDVFQKLQDGKGIKRKRKKKTSQIRKKHCKAQHRDIFS